MLQIEKYIQHFPDCNYLTNHTGIESATGVYAVPCSCGRDKALAEIRAMQTNYLLILSAVKNFKLKNDT